MIKYIFILAATLVFVGAEVNPVSIYPLSQPPQLGQLFLQVLTSTLYNEPLPPECVSSTFVNVTLNREEENDDVKIDLKEAPRKQLSRIFVEFPRIVQVWKVKPFPVVSRFKQSGSYLFYIEHAIAKKKRKARSKKVSSKGEAKEVSSSMSNSSSLLLLNRSFSKFVIQGSLFPTSNTIGKVTKYLQQMEGVPSNDGISSSSLLKDNEEGLVEDDDLEYLNFIEKSLHYSVKAISWLHRLYVKRIHDIYDSIYASEKDKTDKPSKSMSHAEKDALQRESQKRSMKSSLPFYVLGGRLVSMEPTSSLSGVFTVIMKVILKETAGKIVNIKLSGGYNFQSRGDPSASYSNWVSVGSMTQEEFILDELTGETTVIDHSLIVPRCKYYRAIISNIDSKSIMLSTYWSVSDDIGGYTTVEIPVVLSLEVDSNSDQQPYGYGIETTNKTYSKAGKNEVGMAFFTFPLYARVVEVLTNKTRLIPMYIYSIVGGGFMISGDIDSFEEGSTGVRFNWKQMCSTFGMIIIVSLVKFAPRLYLTYKGIDTKLLKQQFQQGGRSSTTTIPETSSFASLAASVVGSKKSEANKMSAEEKELILKKQREIIAEMKRQDGIIT